MEGDGSAFLLFNETNIDNMEYGSVLVYNPDMSVLEPPGTRSKVLDGGLYMAVHTPPAMRPMPERNLL